MKSAKQGWMVAGLAVVAVGLLVLGVRPLTVLFGAVALMCPLMMLSMHGGGHGADPGQSRPQKGGRGNDATLGSDDNTVGRTR
ncbi:MAG TPA: DUF2933 domain-containing protein [Propionibacteriaceae bacterium]